MTSACNGRKKAVFTIETEQRPNRDQLVLAPKNSALEMTAALETDKDQQTPCAKIDLLLFTGGAMARCLQDVLAK
ncbi:hypothetical protein AKN88_05290 [Thiopseudomonas alkaliphila]|uniref:Uncharacterized protein n=2 Tax=Thiopseudomonas alkaliphila TaxID=1697053 RepID=A0A0K1XDK5_9GAMM|nr:hypothetical protein AKN88_05290 [Thiopseudomonas alkaliphila]